MVSLSTVMRFGIVCFAKCHDDDATLLLQLHSRATTHSDLVVIKPFEEEDEISEDPAGIKIAGKEEETPDPKACISVEAKTKLCDAAMQEEMEESGNDVIDKDHSKVDNCCHAFFESPPDETGAAIKLADANGDGQICEDEWAACEAGIQCFTVEEVQASCDPDTKSFEPFVDTHPCCQDVKAADAESNGMICSNEWSACFNKETSKLMDTQQSPETAEVALRQVRESCISPQDCIFKSLLIHDFDSNKILNASEHGQWFESPMVLEIHSEHGLSLLTYGQMDSNLDGLITVSDVEAVAEHHGAILSGTQSSNLGAVQCAWTGGAVSGDGQCCGRYLHKLGDGKCDSFYNRRVCNYDGGDCCQGDCKRAAYSCGSTGYDCKGSWKGLSFWGRDNLEYATYSDNWQERHRKARDKFASSMAVTSNCQNHHPDAMRGGKENDYQPAWSSSKLTPQETLNIMQALSRGQLVMHRDSNTDGCGSNMCSSTCTANEKIPTHPQISNCFMNQRTTVCGDAGCGSLLFTANKNYYRGPFGIPLWLHEVAHNAGYTHGDLLGSEFKSGWVDVGDAACLEPQGSKCSPHCGDPSPGWFDSWDDINYDADGNACNDDNDFRKINGVKQCRSTCFPAGRDYAENPTELAVACTGLRRGMYSQSSR